jgi:hypothetical protein
MTELTIDEMVVALERAIMRLTAHGDNHTEYLRPVLLFLIESQWQPIETAPQGQRVLVYLGGRVTIAQDININKENDEDQQWVLSWHGPISINEMPTHWMPLPSPPKDKQ